MSAPFNLELVIYQSLWGFKGDLNAAINRASKYSFDGLEANLQHPALAVCSPEAVRNQLSVSGLALILEVVTGGDYVPDLDAGPQQQLHELICQLKQVEALAPRRVTVITGSDSWSPDCQRSFLTDVLDVIDTCSVPVSFETHRSRTLFNPWTIAQLIDEHPRLRLTADISHWCAVSERLMSPELMPIQAIADRVDHIHARVGHSQGPSVAHPFAPEVAGPLEAHRRCWQLFVQSQLSRGQHGISITPEFGPDGYMPNLPFTNMPIADSETINIAIKDWLRGGALDR